MKTIKIIFLLLCVAVSVHAEQQDTCVHLNEITVTGLTGSTRINKMPAPVSVVSSEFLENHQYTNIIDAIAKQPGVSQITTGGGISKPVIRGLGYNRVLVVSGGVRQEGQQWGDEHGVEIDGHGVSSAEIMKGPASLMYGSDAMAGVLIFHDGPVLPVGKMALNASAGYQTNNGLFDYSADFAGNRRGFVWDWRYSEKMAHDYKNKYDGYVPASRFRERALSGMLGLNRTWGYSRLRLSYYHLTPGIAECGRDVETGELERVDNGKHYGMQLPFQQVHHYKAVLENSFVLGEGTLKIITAYQNNRRQEYEESRDKCGLDFMLHTVNYDVRYVFPELAGWRINVGVNGMYQRSLNKGTEYLIPAYNLLDLGTFVTFGKSLSERLHLSGGLRFDTRHLRSHALTDDGEERFEAFSRTLNGLTGSIGATYNVSDRWDLKLNISRGFRVPNMSELGSNGIHEGTLRYETGNHDLSSEFSWQTDLGIDYSSEHLSAQLSLFANRIDNFIFLQRRQDMVADGMPVYEYTSGDAFIAGGETRVIIHPLRHLHFENSFSYVSSRLMRQPSESRYLPFTPAPRWLSTLHYDIKGNSRAFSDMYAEVELECNLRQNKVYKANGTETPTPSYTLLNASAGTNVMHRGHKLFAVYLTVSNILNRAYQNHLSRLKYADKNVVTGRTGVFNMGRSIGIKLTAPINL